MLDDDSVIALAVAHRLGRTMKPLGLDTGDVFVTDQSYRTGELMAFAEALVAAERERCAALCEQIDIRCAECAGHNDHDVCDTPTPEDYAAAIRGPNV